MDAFETIHLLELSKYESDCKTFQGMLLEKVITKYCERFRHETPKLIILITFELSQLVLHFSVTFCTL